jgi:hypothetical protein
MTDEIAVTLANASSAQALAEFRLEYGARPQGENSLDCVTSSRVPGQWR